MMRSPPASSFSPATDQVDVLDGLVEGALLVGISQVSVCIFMKRKGIP